MAELNDLDTLKTLSYRFIQDNIPLITRENPSIIMALSKEQLV